MKKNYKWLFWLFLLMFFCVNVDRVSAEQFDIFFKCDGATSNNCPLSIFNGKLVANSNYCDISGNWDGSIDNRKIQIGSIEVSGTSKCYKAEYSCERNTETNYYEIKKLKFVSSDDTKNDAANGIICSSVSLIDMCKDYTKENFKEKCPNAPKDATYEKFRGKCDLSYTDAMNYCEGKRGYYSKSDITTDDIKKWAEEQESLSIDDGVSKDNVECSELFGGGLADIIKNLIFILSVIGVILLVILVSMDFIGAITSSEEGIADAWKKSKIRILATVILLLLPVLTGFIIDVINNNLYLDENNNLKVGNVSECLGETSNS